MDYKIDINLLALDGAAVVSLQGTKTKKKCVVIPVDDNDIYVSVGEGGRAKAAYLHLAVFERREPSKYGDTLNVKQSFSKEYQERIGEEGIKQKPYLGNGRPMERKAPPPVVAPEMQTDEVDELPF